MSVVNVTYRMSFNNTLPNQPNASIMQHSVYCAMYLLVTGDRVFIMYQIKTLSLILYEESIVIGNS